MTLGLAAMMLGVFVVPGMLLWAGHRMRRRSARWHGAFWGAVIGHLIALVAGSIAGMLPPEQWSWDDTLRGALAFWSFVLFPLLGALAGALRSPGTAGRAPR